MFYFRRFAQCGILVTMLTVFSNVAAAVPISSFDFGGSLQVTPGAGLTAATITFNPDFDIDLQNKQNSGDLVGLTGSISGAYSFNDPAGANSVALFSLSAGNTFSIEDEDGQLFTADIDLFQLQGGGGASIFGTIDFSSSTYSGNNAALIELNALIQNEPNLSVTFQIGGTAGSNLDNLFDNGTGNGSVSFSATAYIAVPEPAPLALLGLGLLCSAGFIRRRRITAQR